MTTDKIIIVGGIHHNGLNLARMFGENGIKVDLLCVGDKKKDYLRKSVYVAFAKDFENEESAFDYIKQAYDPKKNRCFIFPYSDKAAYELDNRLNEFCGFFCPSIANEQGKIAQLMDKKNQYDFAVQNGINMMKAFTVYLDKINLTAFDKYPYVLKPDVSVKGNKGDISICSDENELLNCFEKLKKLGYSECLAQEYLKADYEVLIVGAIYKNREGFDHVEHRVIRKWPIKTGSGSYDEILSEKTVLSECERILTIIMELGYVGLIDIELLVADGKVYLNEINWRNSGGGYRSLSTGFYYPYWMYLNLIGEPNIKKDIVRGKCSSIMEFADFYNVLCGKVTLGDWLKQYRDADNFAFRRKGDMRPVIGLYIKNTIKNIIKFVLVKIKLKKYSIGRD